MNDTGLHLGKSKQNQEISELKILVGTNVSHVQSVYISINMYISKPLRWKHLELSEKKIKNQQEKNAKITIYFVHNMSPLFWHQPFHNLVRLFHGLFWGQPIDSAEESGSFCK